MDGLEPREAVPCPRDSPCPAVLALGVNNGTGLAGGTLFDADPTLSRDFNEEDEVHAAWTVGQGPVPGHPQGRLRPGRDRHRGAGPAGRRDGNRGRQLADQRHPGTDPPPEPDRARLATGWQRATATAVASASAAEFQFTTEAVAGTMYCIGHNRNFGNHRATDPDFVTAPAIPRLGIGLAHAATETDDQRDDVDFDACRIRITDADGDALTEADDAATVASGYGTADWDHDGDGGTPVLKVPNKLFLYDLPSAPTFNPGPTRPRARWAPAAMPWSTSGSMTAATSPCPCTWRRAHQPGRHPGTGPPPPGHGDGRHFRHRARLCPCRHRGRRVRGTAGRASGPAQ